jgi:hypothetical protein
MDDANGCIIHDRLPAVFANSELIALNNSLTTFYAESDTLTVPEEWLDNNPYRDASF